jgi:hypothetical protein
MYTAEALTILQHLADGIDPVSGQVFSVDSPYQHPKIVRALFSAVRALERVQECERSAKPQSANAGKAWEAVEDAQLLADFDWGMSVKELAHKHQRSTGAIQSRLLRFGRMPAESTL